MTGRLGPRIHAALQREADGLAGGPAFTADEIVRAGRRAVRRRRVAAAGAVAATVALVAAGVYAAVPRPDAVGPGPASPPVTGTPAPTPSPSRSAGPDAGGVPLTDLGLYAYAGNQVVGPDGSVELPVPADDVFPVARLADAWVVETVTSVWYVPDAGDPSHLDGVSVSALSPDGRVLAGTDTGTGELVAYELPSLRELGRVTPPLEVGTGTMAEGVVGDRVLVRGVQGGPGPTGAAVWDLSTGTVTRSPGEVWLWGMSNGGDVLRRVDQTGEDPKEVVAACIDVVPMDGTVATGMTGYCGAEVRAMYRGSISPDATWVYLGSGDPAFTGPADLLIRADDLRAGRWRPVPVDHGPPVLWDTPTTFLAIDDTADLLRYVRCDTSGKCEPVAMPPEFGPDAQLVRVVGG